MREIIIVVSCSLIVGSILGFFVGLGYGKAQVAGMCAEKGYFQTWRFGERIMCVSPSK